MDSSNYFFKHFKHKDLAFKLFQVYNNRSSRLFNVQLLADQFKPREVSATGSSA